MVGEAITVMGAGEEDLDDSGDALVPLLALAFRGTGGAGGGEAS